QAELDRIALNLTNEEWIGLVDQVRANTTLSAELLGADVSEDTFSIRRVVDLATAKDHYQHLKRSGDTLESSESKKLKSSHSTEQSPELQETTFVSAGATIAAGDPISVVPSVSAAFCIPAETPIAAGVSTTAGVSESAGEASRRKAIADMKAKVKRDKPLTPAQQKEYMRAFVKNQSTAIYTTGWTWKDVRGLTDGQLQNVYNKIRRAIDLATAKDHHQQLKRSGETLESSESKKLKSSHITEQSTELREPTSISVGATIAAGDPIFAVPSVSAATSIPVETPIAAGVSTTVGVSESASVPIIDLLDSPHKATSLPLDPATAEQAVPLRKSSRKKSMARRRTLPRPSQSESAALLFDEDDPEAEFKKDDGTVKRFSTLRELMHWVGRADLMVLYGMVSDKYKLERATGIGLGLWSNLWTLITAREDRDASIIWDDQDQWEIRSWRFYAFPAIHVLETKAGDIMYMFVDKKYLILPTIIQRMLNHGLEIDRDPSGNDLTTAIQLIQSLLNQLHPAT
nr:hypothetical protein [Tanacetum cinerariifolium]